MVCLDLLRQLRLAGCEVGSEAFLASKEKLIAKCARQVLNGKLDNFGTDEVTDA